MVQYKGILRINGKGFTGLNFHGFEFMKGIVLQCIGQEHYGYADK